DARGARDKFLAREEAGVGLQPDAAARTVDFEIVRAEEAIERLKEFHPASLTVVQDRITVAPENRARFVEACDSVLHDGQRCRVKFLQSLDRFFGADNLKI